MCLDATAPIGVAVQRIDTIEKIVTRFLIERQGMSYRSAVEQKMIVTLTDSESCKKNGRFCAVVLSSLISSAETAICLLDLTRFRSKD
jgi:hypothetical protein